MKELAFDHCPTLFFNTECQKIMILTPNVMVKQMNLQYLKNMQQNSSVKQNEQRVNLEIKGLMINKDNTNTNKSQRILIRL